MKSINILFFFVLSSFLACNNPNTSQEEAEQTDTTATSQTEEKPSPLKAVEASLSCRDISTEDSVYPQFEVNLDVNGQNMVLDTINACGVFTRQDYEQYEIPPTALTACGGWYAGAGDYFYLVRDQDRLMVMQGWQDEGQEDEGYHYVGF